MKTRILLSFSLILLVLADDKCSEGEKDSCETKDEVAHSKSKYQKGAQANKNAKSILTNGFRITLKFGYMYVSETTVTRDNYARDSFYIFVPTTIITIITLK